MIVTLDGQRLDDSFSPDCTLQHVIDQVRAAHVQDRLIVSVALNGTILSDADLNDGLEQSVPDDAQVDLESTERLPLVGGALRGLAEQFGESIGLHGDIADRLTSGDATAGIRDVGKLMALWQTCYRALGQCGGLMEEDLTQRQYQGRPVSDYLQELIGRLTELREALEAQDTVMLADLVRYELAPQFETWQALLTGLADQICPSTAAGSTGPR